MKFPSQERGFMTDTRRLGLGLDALLGASASEPVDVVPAAAPPPETSGGNGDGLLYAPLDEMRPNPHQPRTVFDAEDLESLAASIKSSGGLQPIVARRREGMREIVAGE